MKSSAKWPLFLLIIVFMGLVGCNFLNKYQRDGSLCLSGLKESVKVLRDEKGMAYIYAGNFHDALMAQGFVTAQDRLFQMELTRLFASGKIAELVGEDGIAIDTRMRTIGFYRNAKKHANLLDGETRAFFQNYIDGVNAFIKNRPKSRHLEFKLAGIKPKPWTIVDSLTILYYMSWNSAANVGTEIIAQMLIEKVGIDKAREIFPININPDDPAPIATRVPVPTDVPAKLGLASDKAMLAYMGNGSLGIGSNNWTVGGESSQGGKPVVANDPHMETRILPGPWYPCGLITPKFRAVGVNIPGIPGLVIGRNEYIAIGMTNAYGDAQDLYVESVDPQNPDRYLEGDKSLPFKVIEETLTIKDKQAPEGIREQKIKIRLTNRGPVISGVLPGLKTDKVLSLRWSPFETMDPQIGFDHVFEAKSVMDIREALKLVNFIMINFVFADTNGNIGWQASGKLPIRSKGDGTVPHVVTDSQDNWTGWIPFDDMPQLYNPDRGWVGTCNHDTVPRDYPYYYSSHFAPSYRYRRLKQLLDEPGKTSADDHWQFQRDTENLMAKKIAPIMSKALTAHEDTNQLGMILSQWDFHDDPDVVAPAIFQAVYRKFAMLVFEDELGEDLAMTMLDDWYFWEERLEKMVLDGTSPWFDNVETQTVTESKDDLFHQAALAVTADLRSSIGKNPDKWLWGKVHQIEFVSPIRRKGFGKGLVGGGSHPAPGSCETLCRGMYDFSEPFGVAVSASLRMVADLSDNDKVLAVLPGGVSGRLLDNHTKDQIKSFMNGNKKYWWFSDKAIEEHRRHSLVLSPQ